MKQYSYFYSYLNSSKLLLLISTSLMTIVLNLKILFLGLLLFMFIDLITGIKKYFFLKKIKFSLNLETFKHIKSELLRKSLKKFYEYGMVTIVAVLIEILIFKKTLIEIQGENFTLSQLSIISSIAIEIWSIFENIEVVTKTNRLKAISNILPENIKILFDKNKKND